MGKASPPVLSFNAGELSPLMDARVDFEKRASGCYKLRNFLPLVQGPAVFRAGTRFITEVLDSTERSWLVRFEFSATQSYIIEFGDLFCRFYTNHGAVLETAVNITGATQANPVVITAVAHGYANGDKVYITGVGGMTEVNGRFYTVAGVTANTFQLVSENGLAYAAYTVGGTVARVYTIVSPYAVADLINSDGAFALGTAQSGDVIYIAHPSYAPRKLTRTSSTSWAFTTLTPADGPFQTPPLSTTFVAGARTGNGVSLVAGTSIFQAAHVGMLIRLAPTIIADPPWEVAKVILINDRRRSNGNTYEAVAASTTGSVKPIHEEGQQFDGTGALGVNWKYLHSGYGIGRIASYTNGTTVTIDILSQLPDGLLGGGTTADYQFGAWGTATGAEYPRAVTFFSARLVFAGRITVWMSVADSFESFAADSFGLVAADNAITVPVLDDRANTINWIASARGLLIGTSGGQFTATKLSGSEALGPANIDVKPEELIASRAVFPVRLKDMALFVQRAGRRLIGMAYTIASDGFVSSDQTVLAEHITVGSSGSYSGIVDMAWQQEPYKVVWVVLADGTLLSFTFDQEQNVVAWGEHPVGGDGIVECVRVIPSATGGRDDLWMIVRRTINGSTRRYVEWMEAELAPDGAQEDAFHVDSGLTYDSTPTTSITGLHHLEGATVTVLADGATHPTKVVASGGITLDRSSSVVQVGLGYTGILTTMGLEAGAQDGTAQGKTKRIHKAVVRFLRTLGGRYGANETTTDEFQFRTASVPMGQPPPLFTGDKVVPWPTGYETEGRMTIVQNQPLPMTVVGIFPQVETQDAR